MKQFFRLFVVLLTFFLLTACGEKLKPGDVTILFLKALRDGNSEILAEYHAKPGNEIFANMTSNKEDLLEEEAFETKLDYKVINTEEKGKTARVTYEVWNEDFSYQLDMRDIYLVKQKGKWKINMTKHSFD